MNSLFRLLTIVFGLVFFSQTFVFGQNTYNVPIKMGFDQTSFNQLIGKQYENPGFQKTYNETVNGQPVTIAFIYRPFGELSTSLSMRFLLTLKTIPNPATPSVTKLDSLNIKMPFLIESIKLKTTEADEKDNGVYIKLDPASVNPTVDPLQISSVYKPVLKSVLTVLASRDWKIADPSFDPKLFEFISPFYNVKLGNTPTLATELDGKIGLTIDPTITSKRPEYKIKWTHQALVTNPNKSYLFINVKSANSFIIRRSSVRLKDIGEIDIKNYSFTTVASSFNITENVYEAEITVCEFPADPAYWRIGDIMLNIVRGEYEFDTEHQFSHIGFPNSAGYYIYTE